MTMKSKNYKIVVLTDMNDSTTTTVKSTISLAKMIGGNIQLFSVVNATDIVEIDNQLSSMRSINDQHIKMEKQMENMVDGFYRNFGVDIQYSFAFGNVKNELDRFIKETQPDMIVLGKRQASAFKLIGDSITQYILKTFDGIVMIAAEKNPLIPDESLSLGVLNSSESLDIEFAELLLNHSIQPLKSFKTVDYRNFSEHTETTDGIQTVDYVFEQGENSIKNISNYLMKSNVNLLFFERKQSDKKVNKTASNINNIINSIDVSLLLGSR